MGILPGIFKHRAVVVDLTDLGKHKHDNYDVEGWRFDILVYLNDHGKSSISEIAKGCNMEEDNAKAHVNTLLKEGWLEPKSKE